MEEDDPIKKKRSRGGRLDVGDESDGAIISMLNIGERTFVIKERSIYELIMADQVDPERTNIHVPNMIHKLVLNGGIESEIVSQIFLTGSMFFTKGAYPETQLAKVWELVIELNKEAINLKKNIDQYYESESSANAKYDADRSRNVAPALPSISDLETILKTIFQKADHMYQIMVELTSVTYTSLNLSPPAKFDTLADLVKDKLGEKHSFYQFLKENLTFLKTIRELRNGLDHRLKTVTVSDYQFNPDTTISLPSISLKAKDAKFDTMPISVCLENTEAIFSFAEVLICHLADVTVKNMMGGEIREIPESRRRYKHVRYCFFIPMLDFYQQ